MKQRAILPPCIVVCGFLDLAVRAVRPLTLNATSSEERHGVRRARSDAGELVVASQDRLFASSSRSAAFTTQVDELEPRDEATATRRAQRGEHAASARCQQALIDVPLAQTAFAAPTEVSLSAIDSPFQLQEYIAALIRYDPHDVDRICTLPGKHGKGKGVEVNGAGEEGEVDAQVWLYEHLRYVTPFILLRHERKGTVQASLSGPVDTMAHRASRALQSSDVSGDEGWRVVRSPSSGDAH